MIMTNLERRMLRQCGSIIAFLFIAEVSGVAREASFSTTTALDIPGHINSSIWDIADVLMLSNSTSLVFQTSAENIFFKQN